MPTIFTSGRYRVFFYSDENSEPPHVHVMAAEHEAKFWLDPVLLASNSGFRSDELKQVDRIVSDHRDLCMERWNEHFRTKRVAEG